MSIRYIICRDKRHAPLKLMVISGYGGKELIEMKLRDRRYRVVFSACKERIMEIQKYKYNEFVQNVRVKNKNYDVWDFIRNIDIDKNYDVMEINEIPYQPFEPKFEKRKAQENYELVKKILSEKEKLK